MYFGIKKKPCKFIYDKETYVLSRILANWQILFKSPQSLGIILIVMVMTFDVGHAYWLMSLRLRSNRYLVLLFGCSNSKC
jgi:hypothetical protein